MYKTWKLEDERKRVFLIENWELYQVHLIHSPILSIYITKWVEMIIELLTFEIKNELMMASTCGATSIHLQHSPLDDIISDQSSTMEYCLIKNLAKENPVGKNSSEGKKSAMYSWLPLIWTSVALDVVNMSHSNVIHMLPEYCSRKCLCVKICCIVAGLNIFHHHWV